MIWNWFVTHVRLEFGPWEYNFLAIMIIVFLLRLMYGIVDLIDAKEDKLQAETKLIETEIARLSEEVVEKS